ncbi:MAG: protoporphyrinogen oxidase [Gammaproteobacteria bacterium]|nr:protoporphyrinogen oxidase [Gammaproteobacteria bacterium]MBL6999309.1 protoporphyrinogen oxidase [Gammaproteobacteria bacterium]
MILHRDVVIIGGGISGLSCAWWLARKGIRTTILEQADRTGGLIHSTRKDGYVTDHAASMILNFNARVSQFIEQSGLQQHRIERNNISRRYILKGDALKQVPESLRGLLFSDLFSLKTRLQLLTEPFRSRTNSDSESVADFIRRRLGQEILDLAIDPYVSAVLASDPEQACARSVLPRLTALERQFGSISAGILLKKLIPGKRGLAQQAFSFNGGMRTLTEVLAENPLCEIQTSQQVMALEPARNGWRISSHSDTREQQILARQLILSTPAPVAARLLKPLQPELSRLLEQIRYAPIAQIHLGFDQAGLSPVMQGNGFLLPSSAKTPLRGSLFISNLIDQRAPAGKLLSSHFIGGAKQPDALLQSDDQLLDQTLAALNKLCGLKQNPEMTRINRHAQGLPLYHGRYHQLTQAIQQTAMTTNGLHLVANYLQGISIRDRILQASQVADQVSLQLSGQLSAASSHSLSLTQSCIKQP